MYYHPMGLCEILSKKVNRIWRLHAPAAFAATESNVVVYPYLTGITVAIEQEKITSFQVTIDAPYEEGIKMLYEDANGVSPFNPDNQVRVSIGYPAQNAWTPWYYGLMNQGGDGIEIVADGVRGTVSIQQYGWQDGHVVKGSKSWAASASALIQNIATDMKATVLISEAANKRMQEIDGQRFGEPWCTFGMENIKALRKVATICGLMLSIHDNEGNDPTVLEFTLRNEETKVGTQESQVVNTYQMRGIFQPNENKYPLLSWSPEAGIATWLGSKPENTNEGIHTTAINPRTGKVIPPIDVNPGEVENPSYGDNMGKGPSQDNETKEGKFLNVKADGVTSVSSFLSIPTRANASDESVAKDLKSKALMMMTQGNMAQVATITTLGVPTQGLWRKIHVLGCSPRYDGPYFVHGITHRWAPGLYESELKVIRQGTFGTDEAVTAPIEKTQMTKDS